MTNPKDRASVHAYLMRYGHQRIVDLVSMDIGMLGVLADKISEFVDRENDGRPARAQPTIADVREAWGDPTLHLQPIAGHEGRVYWRVCAWDGTATVSVQQVLCTTEDEALKQCLEART